MTLMLKPGGFRIKHSLMDTDKTALKAIVISIITWAVVVIVIIVIINVGESTLAPISAATCFVVEAARNAN